MLQIQNFAFTLTSHHHHHQHHWHLFMLAFIFAGFLLSSHECRFIARRYTLKNDTDNQIKEESQWSEWSEWSTCSRSCDGGISVLLRKCLSKTECVGQVKRYKICNMQPCEVPTDFRAKQCSMFDNKSYRDRFYEWLPYIDPTDPCSLTCKAKMLNFVTRLAVSVMDGTRCRTGSLDMCVAGKCLSVGCDLELGSSVKIDECGICGGDGTSCNKRHYLWSHRFFDDCSRSCGGGIQSSNFTCINEETGIAVDDIFCDSFEKPATESRSCNEHECPPTWIIGDWSNCDKKCGVGKRTRQVFCAVEQSDGSQKSVPEILCLNLKPEIELNCSNQVCPQWYEGSWTECSEGCGNGVQTRPVVCRDSQGYSSDLCETELKPTNRRNCSDISKCLENKSNSQEDSPLQKTIDQLATTEPSFMIGEWSTCNATCHKNRLVECKIYLEFSKTIVTIPESQCPGEKPFTWEICNDNDCKNELVVNYIDEQSSKKKKSKTVEMSNQILAKSSFGWRVAGFSECSTYCLGGIQETVFQCIRYQDNMTVDANFCESQKKPDTYTRTCNDIPCIPSWNTTSFSECSKQCGGGIQTRLVRCSHKVTRGSTNVVVIPENLCRDQTMPNAQQSCNQIDCPAKWVVEPWSQCSKYCGGGLKARVIRCMKELASGDVSEVPSRECPLKKPKIIKTCNLRPCLSQQEQQQQQRIQTYAPVRNFSNELSRKSKRNNNILFAAHNLQVHEPVAILKVEGKSTLYEGSHVKLRCPLSDLADDQASSLKASWSKGNDPVHSSKRYHLFRNVLRIKHVEISDTGVYKCWYRHLQDTPHSMFLHIVPRPNGNSLQEMNNLVLNDHQSQSGNVHNQIYYKNELDLSQEVQKQSFGGREKQVKRDFPFSSQNAIDESRRNVLESGDSGEIGYNRVVRTDAILPANKQVEKIHQSTRPKSLAIGKSDLASLKFDWITTEWSRCTIECSGIGFRMRLTQCYVQLDNITEAVDSKFCIERNLPKPNNIEKCGFLQCSSKGIWKTGQWSECDNCLSMHRGTQTRSINCLLANGTVVPEHNCSLPDRPNENQQCINLNCVAQWVTGKWSQCNHHGHRSRIVQCTWQATKKPAHYSQCETFRKPDSIENCTAPFDVQ